MHESGLRSYYARKFQETQPHPHKRALAISARHLLRTIYVMLYVTQWSRTRGVPTLHRLDWVTPQDRSCFDARPHEGVPSTSAVGQGVQDPRVGVNGPFGPLTPTGGRHTFAVASSVSLGEACTQTDAADRKGRETPTVRTGEVGLRLLPKRLGQGPYVVCCQSSTRKAGALVRLRSGGLLAKAGGPLRVRGWCADELG